MHRAWLKGVYVGSGSEKVRGGERGFTKNLVPVPKALKAGLVDFLLRILPALKSGQYTAYDPSLVGKVTLVNVKFTGRVRRNLHVNNACLCAS